MPAQDLNCANCGAAIDVRTVRGTIAACTYCGTAFTVPASMTPEPTMGDLLLFTALLSCHPHSNPTSPANPTPATNPTPVTEPRP